MKSAAITNSSVTEMAVIHTEVSEVTTTSQGAEVWFRCVKKLCGTCLELRNSTGSQFKVALGVAMIGGHGVLTGWLQRQGRESLFFNGRHHVKFTGEITDAAPDQMDKCFWF